MRSVDRKPFAFHVRYAGGHKNALGYWEADGRTELAETELVKRLSLVMIKRPRDVIWKDTPPKTRQVVRLDVGTKEDQIKTLEKLADERHLFKALEKTLIAKVDAICENVLESLGAGEKCLVWVLTRESVEIMTQALEKATSAKDVTTLMKQQRVRIWATHGEADVKVRNEVARDFREHGGAGVLIATMDSLPESISLFGATTEHYAQLHYLSGPMEQSENRPYLKDTSRLHIIYYIAKGTIDERMENIVLPRLMTADKIGASRDAEATAKAFEKQGESFADFISRLTANMPDDGDIEINEDDV